MVRRRRQAGLSRVLGSLELEIMEVFWHRAPDAVLTIREVRDDIARRRDISFNAVMTVMNRLVEKRLLRRRKGKARSHAYVARVGRDGLEVEVARELVEGLVRDFGSMAVAQFVDAVGRVDPRRLRELERLVRAQRGRKRSQS